MDILSWQTKVSGDKVCQPVLTVSASRKLGQKDLSLRLALATKESLSQEVNSQEVSILIVPFIKALHGIQ